MKVQTSKILLFALITPFFALSQVGIGTTTPNAQLEIKSTNQATPANTDGILVPKVDEFPVTAPTASQDGMMVFVTGSGTPTKGFYYWNNATTAWIPFTSVADKDWYEESTTNPPDAITDDIFTMGNVAIGKNTANFSLDIQVTGTRGISLIQEDANNGTISGNYIDISNTGGGIHYGVRNFLSGIGSGEHYGVFSSLTGLGEGSQFGIKSEISNSNDAAHTGSSNLLSGTGNGNHYGAFNTLSGVGTGQQTGTRNVISNSNNSLHHGVFNLLNGTGNSTRYGVFNSLQGSGSGDKYGSYSNITNSAGGTHYGVYSEVLKAGSFAGYFLGRISIGTTTTNNYILPSTRGFINQVMQTDGSGSVSWVNASTLSTDKNTLDEAYDEGGAGAGSTITATDGIVTIAGEDGLLVTGTINTGDVAPAGAGTKMYFNPRKAAFRAGYVGSNEWDDASVGNYSTAFGNNSQAVGNNSTAIGFSSLASNNHSVAIGYDTTASGDKSMAIGSNSNAFGYNSISMGFGSGSSGSYSTAMGDHTTAYGNVSTSMGSYTTAHSFSETTIGIYNTVYVANSAGAWNASDRLFVVGNGINDLSRSNALTIYKNGLLNINDEYNMPLTDGSNNQVMQTDGSGNVNWVDVSSLPKNTLDQAYDEGGAGAGSTITATDGAVTIAGEDGLLVTGTLGSGDVAPSGAGTKMFFNPRKAAFRAGQVNSNEWDDSSIGYQSVAMGFGTIASGQWSTSFGLSSNASGLNSFASGFSSVASGQVSSAFGVGTTSSAFCSFSTGYETNAYSFAETVIGAYNTTYTPNGVTTWELADRIFVVGNGTSDLLRSNALTIYKNGLLNINDEYNMPLADGTLNQVMQTDGSGNVNWVDTSALNDGDWVTVGADIERQSGDVYIGDTAATNNNLYASGLIYDWDDTNYYLNPGNLNVMNEIQFDVGAPNNPKIRFAEDDSGFYSPGADITSYTANGTEAVRFEANGMVKILNNIDASGTAGTGSFEVAGALRFDSNEIITNTNGTLFVQHDNNGDFRVDNTTFTVDASANNVGIGDITPEYKLDVAGAVMLEDMTAPSATAGHSGIYSNAGELNALDASGNSTVISPHHFSLTQASEAMAWSFYSKNENLGKQVNVDMMKAMRLIEKLSGEKLIYQADLFGNDIASEIPDNSFIQKVETLSEENVVLKEQLENQQVQIEELRKLVQQLLSTEK